MILPAVTAEFLPRNTSSEGDEKPEELGSEGLGSQSPALLPKCRCRRIVISHLENEVIRLKILQGFFLFISMSPYQKYSLCRLPTIIPYEVENYWYDF